MNRPFLIFALLLLTALPLSSCMHTRADKEATLKKCGPVKNANWTYYEDVWDELWPKAKAGDMKARSDLYMLVMGPMHMARLIPPGSSADFVTALRNTVILEVHTMDYWNQLHPVDPEKLAAIDDEALDDYLEHMNGFTVQVGFNRSQRGKRFLKCVAQQSGNCADQAVKDGLVPSFEEYARQIDLHIAAGAKVSCVD